MSTITKEDVGALRDAQTVVLFFHADEEPHWGMRLSATYEYDAITGNRIARMNRNGWTRVHRDKDFHYEKVIVADPRHCQIIHAPSEVKWASWVETSIKVVPHIMTALRAIRTGSSIGFCIFAGNGTKESDAAGVFIDECYLRVVDSDERGKEFMLGTKVSTHPAGRPFEVR